MINISRPMKIMLICVGILFGLVFLYKVFMNTMMKHYIATHSSPTIAVSTMKVSYQPWQPKLSATGSLRAIQGVNITTQLAGMVDTIYFKPGSVVSEGQLLVQLNASTDIAQLQATQANAELAKITYNRDKQQYAVQAVSKQTLDADLQNWKSLQAQVAQQSSTVAKKSIVAPFAGRVGIVQVNLGQFLNPGDSVTMLQTLDPIYVDFYMPQQALAHLRIGQKTYVETDTYPKHKFTGQITTINPGIDTATRNVLVESTIANPKDLLTPGMFVSVDVDAGAIKKYLTVPQAAITFNPYGDIIYIVHESDSEKDENGKPALIAKQIFVTTGETRGDQVTILQGLKEGDVIVTSGQLKLKNGSKIEINNKVQPSDAASVDVVDE